jgi:tetratricopeptide (TPR) repeat protein
MKKNIKNKSDLLAVVLMVKNESVSIEATLSSFFHEGIHHFFIFDTGSTDNTVQLAMAFFEKHQLAGCVRQEPFIDFSSSRNRALELAEQHFVTIPFLLMPDAEWFLYGGEQLLDFCAKEALEQTSQYMIRMKINRVEFYTSRLFRRSAQVRFSGVVHEAPVASLAPGKAPDSVCFELKASEQGKTKSSERWRQDLKLLFAAHIDNPTDSRTAFYLAQTYECLQDFERAYDMYQVREKLNGWDEENFMTLFRLGGLAQIKHKNNPELGWAIAMDYYLKAFSNRPHRIEPLIKIAEHFWPNNIQTCYLFIRYAYDVPYPEKDLLFVDKELYDYTRYEIMSRCAWHMGEFSLGEQATRLALNAQPNIPHLLKNMELYQKKMTTL